MSALAFSVIGARVEPYAASPQLTLRLRVAETTGTRIETAALRVQVRIEPQLRRYAPGESLHLTDLFGPVERYGETLRPLLWTHVSATLLAFEGETEIDLPIPCSYDFEVAAHKYLTALDDGEIPLLLLFSGTIFSQGPSGIAAEFVSWSSEARYRLPVALWRETMETYFPNEAWIRIGRDAFARLDRIRTSRGLPTWDAVLTDLCERAESELATAAVER